MTEAKEMLHGSPRRQLRFQLWALFAGFFVMCASAYGDVTVPNTFKPGSPIKSSEMNANFKALETAVNQQSQATTSTYNSPIIINVRCTGSGAPLQTALDAVNPVLAVYEVRLSGVCVEDIEPKGFFRLTIKSADPAAPASIGKYSNSSSFYVTLQNLIIRFDGASGQGGAECALCNFSMGRTDVFDTRIDCINSGVCETAVNASSGEMRLYSVTRSGTWKSSGAVVLAGRQASLLVSWSSANRAVCFAGDEYRARFGGVIQYAPDAEAQSGLGCPAVRKVEQTGGAVYGI